jgi:hypothetical protein
VLCHFAENVEKGLKKMIKFAPIAMHPYQRKEVVVGYLRKEVH